MRKYILAITLIIIGVIFFIYNSIANNQSNYTDTIFLKEAKSFDKNFSSFISGVEKNINVLQINFNNTDKIIDTIYIKDSLFPFMEEDPYLISLILANNTNKIAIKKDGKSIILATDSTKNLDIVKWQRFENNKLIGSWHESFEEEINKTKWFKELTNTPNQMQWLLKTSLSESKKDSIIGELFYAGYSFPSDNGFNLILMEFSREILLEKFDINPNLDYFSFLIKSNEGKWSNLANLTSVNDSLKAKKIEHFKKFDKNNAGTFSFRFKDETYWSSFKKFAEEAGIQFYLLTISEKGLKNIGKGKKSDMLSKIALFLIFLGSIILLIKKRFFYRPSKRITIPPAKEILLEDENRYLEFKSSARWDYRQEKTNPELEKVILKTLAAFGNTDGGILLIGVDDDKNIIGLEKDFNTLKKSNQDYYEIHLRNILHNMMGVKYVSENIRMQFEICKNQNIICIIKVLAADEPIYLKFKNKNGQVDEKFFVRSGNSSQEIDSIAEINDYLNSRFKK